MLFIHLKLTRDFLNLCMISIIFVFSMAGCSTKVVRTDVKKVVDFSGGWNDTDAQMVAEEMVTACLSSNWINEFNIAKGHVPVVIVGTIKNRTYEHISSDIFVNSLEVALTNSGKVSFVANRDSRQEVRAERMDQLDGNTEPSTVSAKGHEAGADFMLQGSINSIKDAVRGKYTVFYQIDLELVDMKTNQKRWIAKKEIKKVVIRPSVSP